MNKKEELAKLYQSIFQCRCCQSVNYSEVPRQVTENSLNSEIVLMAQAPGESGVRKTGVHWNKQNGTLTRGGIFLNNQLAKIKYSVSRPSSPPRPYTTNVLQCWTGRSKGTRDRRPESRELSNCAKWWIKELEIIHPRILVLLGAPATEYFAQAIDKNWVFAEMLRNQGEQIKIGNIELKVFFLPHPAAPYRENVHPFRRISELYSEVFQTLAGKLA